MDSGVRSEAAAQFLVDGFELRIHEAVIRDGAEVLKGVRINDQTAKIGDVVCFDGKRLFVESR